LAEQSLSVNPGFFFSIFFIICSYFSTRSFLFICPLQTLEKILEELPSSIVREGGLTALLQYLDFFSINVQQPLSQLLPTVAVPYLVKALK
jgi:hypothetical protein